MTGWSRGAQVRTARRHVLLFERPPLEQRHPPFLSPLTAAVAGVFGGLPHKAMWHSKRGEKAAIAVCEEGAV